MIQRDVLLSDLRRLLPRLVADLRGRAASDTTVDTALRAEHEAARKANRTGEAFEVWRDAWLTQVGVAWLLSLVFVRYLEDNDFIPPRLAGSGVRGQRADEHRQLYIRANPTHSDARYLHHVLFDEVGALPGARGLFAQHNLARALAPSGDLATELLTFFAQQRDAGVLRNDFADMRGDTRFLGDLYQDLSEDARERYALLQTPDFVEEFILDHTLEPALETFGLAPTGGFRLIDPTCGSGHFLLGAFGRLLDRWRREAPAVAVEDLAQRALDAVWGVDINPFAVAIARFRLLLAALEACGVRALKDAHDFKLNVTCRGLAAGGAATGALSRRAGQPAVPRRGPRGHRPNVRAAVPRGGRQSAVHHGEGQGAQFGVSRALSSILLQAVFARRAVHGAVLQSGTARRWFCRSDHRELVHEAGVREVADRTGPAGVGSDARDRHVRCVHPRPRHADGDPVRAEARPGRADRAGGAGNSRGADDAGESAPRGWFGGASLGMSRTSGFRTSLSRSWTRRWMCFGSIRGACRGVGPMRREGNDRGRVGVGLRIVVEHRVRSSVMRRTMFSLTMRPAPFGDLGRSDNQFGRVWRRRGEFETGSRSVELDCVFPVRGDARPSI